MRGQHSKLSSKRMPWIFCDERTEDRGIGDVDLVQEFRPQTTHKFIQFDNYKLLLIFSGIEFLPQKQTNRI